MGHVLCEVCRRRVCLPARAARALCERNARENRRKEGGRSSRNRPPGAGPQQRHGTCRARLGRAMASTRPWPAPWIVRVVVERLLEEQARIATAEPVNKNETVGS